MVLTPPPNVHFSLLLLYALFDDASFLEYLNTCRKHSDSFLHLSSAAPDGPDVQTAHAGTRSEQFYRASLSGKYRKLHAACQLSIILLIGLTVVQMTCLILPFLSSEPWDISAQPRYLAFLLLMLVISVALFSLRQIPSSLAQKAAECRLSLVSEDTLLLSDTDSCYHRFHNTGSLFRIQKRKNAILIWIEILLCLLTVGLSILFNSFPIFIAATALTLIGFLECDHLFSRDYAIAYDHDHPLANEKSACRNRIAAGEAKIYVWDYDAAKDTFRHRRLQPLPQCSTACIRYIFFARIDRYQYQWRIAGIVLSLFHVCAIIIGILQFLLPISSFFHISSQTGFLFFCLILLMTAGIYYIILLLRTEERFQNQTALEYYCSDAPLTDDFITRTFYALYEQGVLKNVDISRGIYLYDCILFEKGLQITDIFPPDDRVLVVHRYHDAVRRISTCFLFFTIAYVCIFIWHLRVSAAIWGLPVIAVVYLLFAFVLFPHWDEALMKHKIRKYCNT